MHAKIQLMG